MADLKISQLTGATTPLAGSEVVPLVQSSTTKKVAVSDLTAGREFAAKSMTLSGDSAYAQGKFFTTNGEGTMIACKTGTFFDAGLLAAGLTNYVWTVATGTNNIKFWNDVTIGNGGTNNHTVNGNLIQGTAAKGVNFTANTGAAGMTSQLLNWYEEGTFTPTVYGGTTAGTTTYVSQVGRYTRVGNVVYYRIYVDWSNQTGTGTLYVGGLPFTSVSLGSTTPGSVYANNLTFTANSSLSCAVVDNTTTLFIVETINNTGAGVVAVDTSASLVLAGMYFTS